MVRTERLLAILQAMRAMRTPVTAVALADRFAVSERTIYGDIDTLTRRGATIEGAAGLGFVLRDDFFLPPLSFDEDEAAALMLGLRFVLTRGDKGLPNSAASARGKLTAAAPRLFGPQGSCEAPLLVGPTNGAAATMLATARDALTRERKLRIDYLDGNG